MLQINDLEIIKEKRIIFRVAELKLESSTINALYGEEKSGKSLLTRTIHGLYSNFRGIIDFYNISNSKINSYLITKDVHLLQNESVNDNFSFNAKENLESIREYSFIAGLENDLERKISELPLFKQKLVELSIGCGLKPALLIIDDFDKCFTANNLTLSGKLLSKFKVDNGTVLLTSRLKIPEMDSVYEIDDSKVVQL